MIYSLDIFDTVLLRTESPEVTLNRLPESIREKRLTLHREKYPQDIHDFYAQHQSSIKAELDLECNALKANPEFLNFIAARPNDTFILVSDMYLNSDDIRYLLKKTGVPDFFEALYVSSEYGTSKEQLGQLFEKVAEDYGKDITHIGDTLKSDFVYPNMRLARGIHYVKELAPYTPDFSSLDNYYRHYCDSVLAPILFLSLEKIKRLVIEKNLQQIICVGSVYDFYKALLQPHFPDIEIKKLEISRYNIRFLTFPLYSTDALAKMPHTGSFLQHYYPKDFDGKKIESLFQQWQHYSEVIEKNRDDLLEKSTAAESELQQQLADKGIQPKDILFVDFGYQGSFCEFIESYPLFKDNNNHVFLSVKEHSPKHNGHYGIEIQPFKIHAKGIRDPFWILDAEIIIKKANATPLAFSKSHKSSNGWPEMYEYLLERAQTYRPDCGLYELERELAHKAFKHLCLIDDKTIAMFNALSEKVRYNKYSMVNDYDGVIRKQDDCIQINIDGVVALEKKQAGCSHIGDIRTQKLFNYDKKMPFFQYYRYIESIHKNQEWFHASD